MANDEAPAAHVIEALRRVVRDLPAITRGDRGEQGYSYRGIDRITAEVAPLFGKHGVIPVPDVLAWDEEKITINNRPWTDQRLKVLYRFYGPGGRDDFICVGPIPAIGRDNSDKGTNKAMTQAYKYALLQVLCIGDRADDADGQTHERDIEQVLPEAVAARFVQACTDEDLSEDDRSAIVLVATGGRTSDVRQVWASQVNALREAKREYTQQLVPANG